MSTPKPKFFFPIAQTYTRNGKPVFDISATGLSGLWLWLQLKIRAIVQHISEAAANRI